MLIITLPAPIMDLFFISDTTFLLFIHVASHIPIILCHLYHQSHAVIQFSDASFLVF